MITLNFELFPLINTGRLHLREVSERDADEVFFLRSDESVMRYIDRPPAESTDDALAFIRNISEIRKNNEGITWAITIKGDSKLIGTIGYWNIQKEHFRAEVGYVLHPDYWGKGIMHEALSEVLKYGFEVMKLHSIAANVNPDNIASIKLLERNNFKREAYFRENYFYSGKFLDSAIYSLLISEYK